MVDISLVIPAFNEEESLSELFEWIDPIMQEHGYKYEVIFIDDGSTDGTWEEILKLSEKNTAVNGVSFRRNYGKSAALQTGFELAKGDVLITMDADLQDNPEEIPALYNMVMDEGYDLVSGWKKKRHDPLSKTIPSKFFNWVTRLISGIKIHDFNCGLKAYSSEVVKSIEVYGEMHRYIPVIAKWEGFAKIGEKVVVHKERKYGKSKFGLERFINGFLDLLSINFVGKFAKRPMHLFGTWGIFIFMIGLSILLYLSISKLFMNVAGMTDRPIFYFGILCFIVGSQLFFTGFLAELMSRFDSKRNNYQIVESTGESIASEMQKKS